MDIRHLLYVRGLTYGFSTLHYYLKVSLQQNYFLKKTCHVNFTQVLEDLQLKPRWNLVSDSLHFSKRFRRIPLNIRATSAKQITTKTLHIAR